MVMESLEKKSDKSHNQQAEIIFHSVNGDVQLQRYPYRKDQKLRAWDAADEYLLQHVMDQKLLAENMSLLIVNDIFGGLSLPLQQYKPLVMTDSYLSRQAIVQNSENNHIALEQISFVNSLDDLSQANDKSFDLVLLKIPKSLAMLEDQLYRIRAVLGEGSSVIAAGMTKNIHNSTLALFEKIIGATHSSLARKKARLIFSQFDAALDVAENPYPESYALPMQLDGETIQISNHAAVFSQAKLDIGSRFLLENIPADEKYKSIVDLGCGNGAVGLIAAIKNPQARLIFTDESFMAVDSAISNFVEIFQESREAEFLQTDCLAGVERDSVSLILCNPPFHQNNTITDEIAWQMFTESKEVLELEGELWVIGNRHLSYFAKLKHLFGRCEVVASNKKFSILKAVKSGPRPGLTEKC